MLDKKATVQSLIHNRVSSIPHRFFIIFYPVSSIEHPVSRIASSFIQHPVSSNAAGLRPV
jgi:hypothetical protein